MNQGPAHAYHLYENHPNDRARLHRDGCGYIKMRGGGTEWDSGRWTKFVDRDEALLALDRCGKRDSRRCARCAP